MPYVFSLSLLSHVILFFFCAAGAGPQCQVRADERLPDLYPAAPVLLCRSHREDFVSSDHEDRPSRQDPQYGLAHLPCHLQAPWLRVCFVILYKVWLLWRLWIF